MEVVGFEGDRGPCPLTFGTAAFRVGDEVLNPITRARIPLLDWDDLVGQGYVAAVTPHPLPVLKAALLEKPCMLMRIDLPEGAADDAVRTLQAQAAHRWRDGFLRYLLFPSYEALETACRPAVQMFLRSPDPGARKAGQILDGGVFGKLPDWAGSGRVGGRTPPDGME